MFYLKGRKDVKGLLRLASVQWRLRRTTSMETGMFNIQTEHLRDYRQSRDSIPVAAADTISPHEVMVPRARMKADVTNVDSPRCFLRLANLPNCALDGLCRYEATLLRQAGRILFALEGVGSVQTAGAEPPLMFWPRP